VGEGLLITKLNMIDAQIQHEDDLIGQRMSWLVISQSFLFGTLATLIGQRGLADPGAVRLLLVLIPLVGGLLSVLVLAAVGAANYAMWQWRAALDRICALPEARQLDWPRLRHRRRTTMLGDLLPIAVSGGFFLAWVVILIKMA